MEAVNESSNVTLTCPVCDVTVNQPQGTRRTICPYCGNFYDTNAASNPRLLGSRPQPPPPPVTTRRVSDVSKNQNQENGHLPSLRDDKEDNERVRGGFQQLTNFFQKKLAPRRQKSGESNHPRKESTSNGDSLLPPIASESKGRLTANNTPSPSPRPPTSSTPTRNHHHGRSRSVRNHESTDSDISINGMDTKRITNTNQLRLEMDTAKESANWSTIQEFYVTTFESFANVNSMYKRDPSKEYKSTDDCGLGMDYVYSTCDFMEELPENIKKGILKAIINSLLKDRRLTDTTRKWPHTKDDLRAYLILVLNPQFSVISTFVIFAHLLRQMAALSDHDHHYLVHWFKRLEKKQLLSTVQKLHNFIACRLFPPKPQDLPPMTKCSWWIPSATKVLALLNAGNNLVYPPIISYMEFYNSTLDHLDLMSEYYTWQNPTAHPGFSFCQYPFILSIAAKRSILQRDSEQQMIIMARRSLVAKVKRRQMPDIGMLFLNLAVRRSHLVSDSLNEIARKQHDLKKKLKVVFHGEPGLDMGGLTKEWFLLLVRQIFQQEYGMFVHDAKSNVFWFSSAPCENYQEFNLVGVLMGLAVYNSIILDIHFPPVCYRKLLSPAVVPYNDPQATVGVCKASLRDLEHTLPDLAHGLRELIEYEGDVDEDFGMTFQVSYTELGSTRTHNLKTNGENIPVTNSNRKEFVQLYVDYLLNKSVYRQFQAFYHGFHSVCASNALIMLRPEEVELLVCGHPHLDMAELKKVTKYDGFTANDQTIRHFWEVVISMPDTIQRRFLLFCTGSDRMPIGGLSEMTFKITRVDNTSMLPMSHTCFNQLVLPPYKSKKALKLKLTIAIENAEGFGLE